MQLIEAVPRAIQPLGNNGWYIAFGEAIVGHEVGAIYLLTNEQYYVRFKVVQGEGIPMYQPVTK